MKTNKKMSNKKIVTISFTVMAVILAAAFSFALWNRTFTQTGSNVKNYDCFNIVYSESTTGVTQINTYPMTDSEGLATTPYTLTIQNVCDTYAKYNIMYNVLNTSTLSPNYVRVGVNNTAHSLSSLPTKSSTLDNATTAYVLTSGNLNKNEVATINVRTWVDENTSEANGTNKTFYNKLTVETVAAVRNSQS